MITLEGWDVVGSLFYLCNSLSALDHSQSRSLDPGKRQKLNTTTIIIVIVIVVVINPWAKAKTDNHRSLYYHQFLPSFITTLKAAKELIPSVLSISTFIIIIIITSIIIIIVIILIIIIIIILIIIVSPHHVGHLSSDAPGRCRNQEAPLQS